MIRIYQQKRSSTLQLSLIRLPYSCRDHDLTKEPDDPAPHLPPYAARRFDAGDNWFWAIDNVRLSTKPIT